MSARRRRAAKNAFGNTVHPPAINATPYNTIATAGGGPPSPSNAAPTPATAACTANPKAVNTPAAPHNNSRCRPLQIPFALAKLVIRDRVHPRPPHRFDDRVHRRRRRHAVKIHRHLCVQHIKREPLLRHQRTQLVPKNRHFFRAIHPPDFIRNLAHEQALGDTRRESLMPRCCTRGTRHTTPHRDPPSRIPSAAGASILPGTLPARRRARTSGN